MWLLSRAEQSFLSAFAVAPPALPLLLGWQEDTLLAYQEGTLQLTSYSPPRLLLLNPASASLPAKLELAATSASRQDVRQCFVTVALSVAAEQRLVLPTGVEPPTHYAVNYPGLYYLRADEFVTGSDILYSLEDTSRGGLPEHWLLQVNLTTIVWDSPPPTDPAFVRQESQSS